MRMKLLSFALAAAMLISCGSCAAAAGADEVLITLSDSGITVDGKTASTDSSSAVYTGNDIIMKTVLTAPMERGPPAKCTPPLRRRPIRWSP